MEATVAELKATIGALILLLILSGNGDLVKSSHIPGKVNKTELNYLAASMQLENESGGDECLLLTGSVILNRMNYPDLSEAGDGVEGVILSHKWGWQYAYKTRKNFKTLKADKHIKVLAKYLLVYGPICPENVIYQSQNSKLGSKLYKKIKTTSGWEYFAYE